jgi:hypothetical protein
MYLCDDEGCPQYGTPHVCVNVTKEMVNAAWNRGKELGMTGLPRDFREVLVAALAAPARETE